MKHGVELHGMYRGFFDLGKLCISTSTADISTEQLTTMKNDIHRGRCWLGLDLRSTNVLWGLDLLDLMLLGVQHIRTNFNSNEDEKMYNSLYEFYDFISANDFEYGYTDCYTRTSHQSLKESSIKNSLTRNTLKLLNLMNLGCLKIYNIQNKMGARSIDCLSYLLDLLDLSVYGAGGTCTYVISAPSGVFSFVFDLRIPK